MSRFAVWCAAWYAVKYAPIPLLRTKVRTPEGGDTQTMKVCPHLVSAKVSAKVSEDLKLTETGMLNAKTVSLRVFVGWSAICLARRAGISSVHKKRKGEKIRPLTRKRLTLFSNLARSP